MPILEIEYPITVYFETEEDGKVSKVTHKLYRDGTRIVAYSGYPEETFYGAWEAAYKTESKIMYAFTDGDGVITSEVILFRDHRAIFEPGDYNLPGYWKTVDSCIEEESPTVKYPITPTVKYPVTTFEIEYPITVYFNSNEEENFQSTYTFYEDGTIFVVFPNDIFYGIWTIAKKTHSKIIYTTLEEGDEDNWVTIVLFSDHRAMFEFGEYHILGYWK